VHIGRLLRQAREARELSQDDLAAMSGVRQSAISEYERERRVPGWTAARRLFAAMGLQMRIELEPLDADLDRLIDAYAALPWQERARRLPYCLKDLDGHFAGVPLVVAGAGAAALQGVPVPVNRADLLVLDTDPALQALCERLRALVARLWDPQRQWWFGSAHYPAVLRQENPTLWQLPIDQVGVTLVDPLPDAVTVTVDDAKVPVLPLHEIELTDPEAARLLERARERRRAIS
jgi:transcriptional regulator with XRE-family HTH domain